VSTNENVSLYHMFEPSKSEEQKVDRTGTEHGRGLKR
jgi:hypothetical protein